MRVFYGTDFLFRTRTPLKGEKVAFEYQRLASKLRNLVDNQGVEVYFQQDQLCASAIDASYIRMISAISPQIKLICGTDSAVAIETVVDQMYCNLLKKGYSRSIISDFLYAIFFSMNRQLNLSRLEKENLGGSDTFIYQEDSEVLVNDQNIEKVEKQILVSDQNAMVGLACQILSGNIRKYLFKDHYAIELLRKALNHGSSKAALELGNDCLKKAKSYFIPNNYYSKAYEYYTVYGARNNSKRLGESHTKIVDILNLGIYNRKMLLNYLVIALLFSMSFFIPSIVSYLGFLTTLSMSLKSCIFFTVMEYAIAVSGMVVRRFYPFFTQGWIGFFQAVLWLIGMIIMVT